MKPPVGVDVDEVLADFISAYVRFAHELFGKPALGTQPTSWDFGCLGLSPEEKDAVWRRVAETQEFWYALTPLPGTSLLARYNGPFEPVFITSRHEVAGRSVETQTAEWLWKHFGLADPRIVVASDKGEVASALGLVAHIDDRVEHVAEVRAACPEALVVIQDRPYNREFNPPGIIRVRSFNEFWQKVHREASRSTADTREIARVQGG